MKSQLNILRQLQELVLTRDEHHQTGDGSHLDELNDSIAELEDKLEPQVRAVYMRLYKKSHIVMAAMAGGNCSGCGMQVPIAQGQQVRLAQHLVTCSSCGRILFANEADDPTNVTEKPSATEDPKTGIARFSAEALMIPEIAATNECEAITALAQAMEKGHFIANADGLITAAMERESVLSTATDTALAFPHVRGVEGGSLTLAIGTSKKGIPWGGETVHIVCLSAIPVAVSAFYLRLMGGLAQAFNKPENVSALLAAPDPAALWKALVKATRHTVK